MDLISTTASAVTGLKELVGIAKALNKKHVDDAVEEETRELVEKLITMQMTMLELATEANSMNGENESLKAELKSIRDFKEELSTFYKMKKLKHGGLVYESIPEPCDPDDFTILLCVNCASKGEKSFLQPSNISSDSIVECKECAQQIRVSGEPGMAAVVSTRKPRRGML